MHCMVPPSVSCRQADLEGQLDSIPTNTTQACNSATLYHYISNGGGLQTVMQSLTLSCALQAEIEGLLGTSLTKLFEDNPSQQRSIPIAAQAGGFKLQQRSLHVFAEAQRVRDFQKVCNNAELSQDDKLKQLGDYMDASQTSCRCSAAFMDMSRLCCQYKLLSDCACKCKLTLPTVSCSWLAYHLLACAFKVHFGRC